MLQPVSEGMLGIQSSERDEGTKGHKFFTSSPKRADGVAAVKLLHHNSTTEVVIVIYRLWIRKKKYRTELKR